MKTREMKHTFEGRVLATGSNGYCVGFNDRVGNPASIAVPFGHEGRACDLTGRRPQHDDKVRVTVEVQPPPPGLDPAEKAELCVVADMLQKQVHASCLIVEATDNGLLGDLIDLQRLIAAQADRVQRVHDRFASRTGRRSGE